MSAAVLVGPWFHAGHDSTMPLLALALLGAFHGINPAMGWLFAVARGLQERSRGVVMRSLVPLAIGHELSILVFVVPAIVGAAVLPEATLRIAAAVALVGFGAYRLARPGHPRWVGMRVSGPELMAWSFLMSSAHGAGLMLMPTLVTPVAHAAATVPSGALDGPAILAGATGLGVHVVAMVAVMGTIAVVVYEWLGVGFLRRSWLNLDRIWAAVLVGAGILTVFT